MRSSACTLIGLFWIKNSGSFGIGISSNGTEHGDTVCAGVAMTGTGFGLGCVKGQDPDTSDP